ncbi:glycerol-3-phosphate 1-O-acyltransferase PlsY [Heyndrickxia oleronia]|uniref:Glycerol-3-phosphate acyltransferase n=1 Tax=Heyndrickxia oleronia TaxID=38875 RepID=A0A8E2IAQ7_9BACI|nr:glycerol-3-phosphate 1-O-acyltransferase PlsY [Heyndrickxia oleronia]NYV64970.1 glycerol-3-phosphate 1-O-acyltransferase PlsY [Bacillus sp. Gen3]OJH19458.1 glycerol-3-phosphate acyltransferase [Bacillus obstructivus]MBU5210347.1 glycerol-3-phosphate 1-O-acyltransferase PlsY [Heyndrickxia oleronia]MCM3236398.1 glycerol-3-phosphate 1-O-acyltransferase PlsY [Heyndrickxia oleronia]MCM3453797.1 glycerol-3-phosphate 1-O-acyltransferase PlsY [Heyndrickxia oleronia]
MTYALIIILAYLLGSIPSGLIVGKLFYGIDIRQHGSGNLGGTNSFRTLGVKAGIAVTAADILKGTLATLLPIFFGVDDSLHPLLIGLFAVIGHMFPIFAGFRGGKAVATSGGVLLAYVPLLFILLVIVFLISLKICKYVSLSSIIAGIFAIIYSVVDFFITKDWPLVVIVFALAGFVIYRHRTNISRIKNKTEPKVKWI